VVDLLLVPVLVQGPSAASSIAEGIEAVNRQHPEVDVMIVGRGGGSLEELWAFNEEQVARSIYASKIPVISAVGHETDVTIADFVADVRAETPTAAAVLAAPDTDELREYIGFLGTRLDENLGYMVDKKSERLQRMDMGVFQRAILSRIDLLWVRSQRNADQVHQAMEKYVDQLANRVQQSKLVLEHLDPKSIMDRGYAAITNENGKLVTSIGDVKVDEQIAMVVKDGKLGAIVNEIERE
jgi:exodeoxyribonuclease VII large subunit